MAMVRSSLRRGLSILETALGRSAFAGWTEVPRPDAYHDFTVREKPTLAPVAAALGYA